MGVSESPGGSAVRLDHLYVETRHWDRAVAFWSALGFHVAATWGEAGHRACRLAAGEAAVVLAEAEAGQAPAPPTLHLGVPDVDALARAAGAVLPGAIALPPEDTHWGTRWMRVRDPDGNVYAVEGPRRIG